ncbi:transmembrane protein 56 [Cladophialophora carrionii]|uniref:Transmembrane protein 56 n=1 Tax=Cladophialophora carrionii TaxID=86049 RepID=A0A1C1CSF8_9EURO|nr:transmembrane protein 56 [Cladophialophora carrionii]
MQTQIYGPVATLCDALNLPLLPTYLPGIVVTFSVYHLIYTSVGPWLSTVLFPKSYPALRGRQKLHWDENAVSFVQAIVLCVAAGQVVLFDRERQRMTWQERVWAYTEPTAVVLTVGNGYFYWHLMMMVRYRRVFGWAMVAHALAVSFLMTNGYRPAFMTYSPASFLYEFSTIFLDIQSVLRALQMEGTTLQIVNGVAFFVSFFLSRILFGNYLQAWFYLDIWRAYVVDEADIPVGHDRVPTWLLAGHALSSIVLQVLNHMWFYKIGRTVYRKLFAEKVAKT